MAQRTQKTDKAENGAPKGAAKRYCLARDLIIPKGTKLLLRGDTATALLGVTGDTDAEWTMPREEAIEAGLIEEMKD